MSDLHLELLFLPTSALSHSLSFLPSKDLLGLRVVSGWFRSFIQSDENDIVWRQALVHDFKFSPGISIHDLHHNPLHFLRSLRIREDAADVDVDVDVDDDNTNANSNSIFGYPPSESVFVARNSFESWRHWAKASAIFCARDPDIDVDGDGDGDEDVNPFKIYINGPYFLRAAKLWSILDKWCNNFHQSGEIGPRIKESLLPGVTHASGRFSSFHRHHPQYYGPIHAFEAIFAFHDGQVFDRLEHLQTALFGGYNVYDHHRCAFLYSKDRCANLIDDCVDIAGNVLARQYNNIVLNVQSGNLYVATVNNDMGGLDLIPAYDIPDDDTDADSGSCTTKKNQVGLMWLEEYVRRLDSGEMRVRSFKIHGSPILQMISPFPNYPSTLASREVTKGVEVIASSYPDKDISVVVYSLRIRILNPGEDEYMTPSQRGFETCQLFSRHWVLTNNDTRNIDNVDGEGVVGFYPLLREGGYRDDQTRMNGLVAKGEEKSGTFCYQSCANIRSGYFEGSIKFFPGSIDDSKGPAFYVNVGRFSLDAEPDIWY